MGIIKVIKKTASNVADRIAIKIINKRIKNYGTVVSLKIDRALHEIDITLTLHGEPESVHVISLLSYRSFHNKICGETIR